ncbi:MFS transporter [Paenibacillus sabinae]|uniref:Major facilitator superfamily protein n=1 Tax=Paenibacillus sabinae T27 TaxID=1268072 RepID=X4ZCS9_9BACL|nr:MFS transporter [Paenibacillus sabinae]AHV97366.1 major facilitator superfamily protein [Paenibacillus sabinae T27]
MTSSIAEMDSDRHRRGLSSGLILMLAITSGLGVANLYYNQPLLADIGRAFNASPGEVGYVSMFTQIGYALGMLLFVPLGDIREKRKLISLLLICVALSLVSFAESRSLGWMYFASFAIGFTTVTPQIIVPLAAQLAQPEERGRVIGTVMSGLLFGILLARTVSGIVGDLFGWRSMYWIAAACMLLLSLLMYRQLPATKPQVSASYGALLRSMLQLARKYATLREASLIGACMFGSFSVFWTSLTFFLEGPPYHYTSSIAGLFGLVGVAGAAGAPIVGRLADKVPPYRIIGALILLTLLSFVLFGLTGFSIAFLIAGVVILDLGIQGTQVSNQARIYALEPAARSRINTVFMVSTFAGGSIGSTLGSFAWHTRGWIGVCLAGGGLVFAAFAVWSAHRMTGRKPQRA